MSFVLRCGTSAVVVAIEDIDIDDDEDDDEGLALLLLTCNEAAKLDRAVAVSFLFPASPLAVMYTPVLLELTILL